MQHLPRDDELWQDVTVLTTWSPEEEEVLTMPVVRQNADPDVRHDMETFLNTTVPEVRCSSVQHCRALGPDRAENDAAWQNDRS